MEKGYIYNITKIIEVYIEKKEVYIISTSQKKKVDIVSTSLVLLSFLLVSPNLLFYLIIFFSVFSQSHVWIFTKTTTVRNYIYTLLQMLVKGN